MPRMPYTAPATGNQGIFYSVDNPGPGGWGQLGGTYPFALLLNGALQYAYMTGHLPFTPSAIYAVYIPANTGNIYRQVTTGFSAFAAAWNTNTDSIAYGTYAVTATLVTAEDITAAFTGLVSGMQFGCEYRRDATNASDTSEGDLRFLGLWFVP